MVELENLKAYLEANENGPIADEKGQLEALVAQAWDCLSVVDRTNMRAEKLFGRTEDIRWERPNLFFSIERHGQTVNGLPEQRSTLGASTLRRVMRPS